MCMIIDNNSNIFNMVAFLCQNLNGLQTDHQVPPHHKSEYFHYHQQASHLYE